MILKKYSFVIATATVGAGIATYSYLNKTSPIEQIEQQEEEEIIKKEVKLPSTLNTYKEMSEDKQAKAKAFFEDVSKKETQGINKDKSFVSSL